ncbi:transcription/translation regulatory transformer protein RfaH [Vibrio sp. JC009]|uniref:transcription/translation regulatory transformer protein RfaH n=1 Tax=Vibrio sp. JC009 TaxID=2912314 RepID=UPI0023B20371|nr:transcription/translation regulatory transformer protein RfaH [Vibrio sp. JC009]WED20988.1 transcription/translation regulatory transformer protein RfaH [Vibrio sp. JC009]
MKRWYLLYCKRGDQARAQMHLENQGVECFYPQVEVEKIVRGKRQVVKEPLFPSYIFIRFDYEEGPSFTTVRSTRGVVDFIRQGSYPQEVTGSLVYELRQLEGAAAEPMTDSLPEKGQEVRIREGQFAGIDAIYHEPDGEKRSILLIKLISQTVEVSVDNKDIEL